MTTLSTSPATRPGSLGESIAGLYPSTTFYAALFAGITAFIVPSYWYGFAIVALVIAISFVMGEGRGFLKTLRNSLMILGIFMFLMRALFTGGAHVLAVWGPLEITAEGVNAGLSMVARVLALGSALLLFFRITPVKRITSGLENAGMPPSATYVILSAIQMIPEMKKQSDVIMDAQKTRGVETEGNMLVRAKAFVPTLSPLVLSSIASTEERVITLEARAFTAPVAKTRLYVARKHRIDRVVQLVLLIAFIAIIAGRVTWSLL